MLMDICVSAVVSAGIDLRFDDGKVKHCEIGKGDLVSIDYNFNGYRRHVEGKVCKVYCAGSDPKDYYLIIDGSDDFKSQQVRFSIMSILDCEVITKACMMQNIYSPNDITNIKGLRVLNSRLQYTTDGRNWNYFAADEQSSIEDDEYGQSDDVIYDEEGV